MACRSDRPESGVGRPASGLRTDTEHTVCQNLVDSRQARMARETVSRSSPRDRRSTAAVLRCRDILT
jgi:hypothetical protein